jgi:hypothetical protein
MLYCFTAIPTIPLVCKFTQQLLATGYVKYLKPANDFVAPTKTGREGAGHHFTPSFTHFPLC